MSYIKPLTTSPSVSGSEAERSRIAIVLPDLQGGGAERVGINLANELARRGYLIDLVLMRVEGELLQLVDQRVQIIDLTAPRVRFVLPALVKYFKRASPRGVVVHMWPLTIVAVVARALARISTKLILVEHTNWSASEIAGNKFRLFFVGITMRLMFPFAESRVVVSSGARNDIARISGLLPEQFTVLNNPVVGCEVSESIGFEQVAEDWWNWIGPKILAVGSLRKDKDFATLLRAFERIQEESGARLLILGEGGMRIELEQLATELGVIDRLSMPGFTVNPTPYFERADLFVLSSTAEGLPTVIIEALAVGTPIVSTDCPSGPREILEEGRFGTLVRMGDPEKLAKAMQDSLSSEHDSDPLICRAQDFSVRSAADAYLKVLGLSAPDEAQRGSSLK